MAIYELPDSLAQTVVEGGPVGPEVKEPLELLVLDHADPAVQHAVIQNTTSLLEHPLAQPETSLGGGLVERISDGEPAARQVPDTFNGSGRRCVCTSDTPLAAHHTAGLSLALIGFPGQWTHGGDVVSGAIGAVDSSIIMDCTTS